MKTTDIKNTSKLTAEVFFRRRSNLASLLTEIQEGYKRRRAEYVAELLHGTSLTRQVAEDHLITIRDLSLTAQLVEEEIAELDRQWNNQTASSGLD